MSLDLRKKDTDVKGIAEKALKNDDLISELVKNLKSQEETVRYNSYKILLHITEVKPDVLYSSWDFLKDMLDSKNTYWRSSSAQLLGNLTAVDSKNKFEKIFDKYYDLLNDSVIIACHLASNSGKIVKAKPNLETEITNKLLDLEKSTHKHKDLIIGGAIEAFNEFFEESIYKNKIMNFVYNQKDSSSPKTRKIVKEFIRKWEGT